MSGPGYGCALGDASHHVNWLLTHISPPLTISVCDDDFPLAVIPLLASSLGVDQARLYDTVKRFTDREAAREAKEASKAAEAIDQAERDEMADPGDYDPGPEVDDQGGMSEISPLDPDGEVTRR